MHIALDTSALDPNFRAHAIRGTGRYVSELSSRLTAGTSNSKMRISKFRYTEIGKGGFLDRCIGLLPAGRTTLRHQVAYPLSLTERIIDGADLIHFPVHADAPAWCRHPYVVTVLDLIPLIFKELYAPKKNDRRFRFARWLELRSIINATLVLVISENTGKDVHELLGVPWEKIVVTPLGVNEEFFEVHKRPIPKSAQPTILYVGGIDQRKNISFLLQTFAEVRNNEQEQGRPAPLLQMVGKIDGDAEYPKMHQEMKRLGLTSEHVHELGYVSDEELLQLYQSANVFFYPSLYEGFGLPPLEAMAAGCAVVSSNTSSLPEVIGDAGLLFNPSDKESAVRSISSLLADETYRQSMIDHGRIQSKAFTWGETVRKTGEGYQRALSMLRLEKTAPLKVAV